MIQPHSVQAFPWQELVAVQSERGQSGSAHRRMLDEICPSEGFEQRLAETMEQLLSADLQGIKVVEQGFGRGLPDTLGADLQLRARQGDIWLSVEPTLITFLLRRLLRAPEAVDRPGGLSDALQGAVHAIANAIARRICTGEPPRVDQGASDQTRPKDLWHIHFWCRISGASFRGNLATHCKGPPPTCLATTSNLPIRLPLVIAQASIARQELSTLRIGDTILLQRAEVGFAAAWASPEDTSATEGQPATEGHVIAAAPMFERGLLLGTDGTQLVFSGVCDVPFEPPTSESEANQSMNDPNEAPASGAFADTRPSAPPDGDDDANAVLSAPVTVRLELGAVNMQAKDWLKLGVGDVVGTTKPVGSEVTLRAGGQVVGYGKLVTVDGNLGVQLSRISSGE